MVLLQDKTIFLHTGHKVSSEDNNTAKEYHAIFRTKDRSLPIQAVMLYYKCTVFFTLSSLRNTVDITSIPFQFVRLHPFADASNCKLVTRDGYLLCVNDMENISNCWLIEGMIF